VLVGDIDGIVLSASPGEVRVDFFVPHGTAAGPRTVTVSGPGGSASRADALELTFYIVAPAGTADGRGTYQSPISLCDLRDALPRLGDTASLLAGDHVCSFGTAMELPGGMTVAGAGSDVTVLRGAVGSFDGFRVGTEPGGFPSVFRGFTIEASAAGALILDGRVNLVADDLVIEGAGIIVQTDGFATMTVTGLRQSGPGIGIDGRGRMELTMTGSRFSDCTTGLLVRGGSADVTDTVFERCQLGVRGGFIDGGLSDPFVGVIDSEFVDDVIGVAVGRGFTSVSNSVFTDLEVTTQASQAGARVGFGTLYISGSEISGMDQAGIIVQTDGFATMTVTGLRQSGPGIGIDGRGRMELTMTGSRFSDCTTGLLVRGGSADVTDTVFERCQLGVRGGFIDGGLSDPFVSVIDSEFVDDVIGVAVGRGFTSVSNSVFTDLEVTTQASQAGARVGFGTLYISGSEISGMDQIGISVEGSGTTEGFAHAVVTNVTIIGGPIGIQLGGFPDDETLAVRNSIVRDQTVASVLATADGSFAIIDLGNDGGPGGNQLSVVSGVALLDARPDPFPGDDVMDCTGITLNGRTYSGLVEGAAESLPDYQITGSGILQF